MLGINSKGAMTICGNAKWEITIETSLKKDVECKHGCFPVDDLIHVEVVEAGIAVQEATVKIEGGAFEWFLESLIALLMPIIKYVANEYVVEEHDL